LKIQDPGLSGRDPVHGNILLLIENLPPHAARRENPVPRTEASPGRCAI
jgi:hypothetical protein